MDVSGHCHAALAATIWRIGHYDGSTAGYNASSPSIGVGGSNDDGTFGTGDGDGRDAGGLAASTGGQTVCRGPTARPARTRTHRSSRIPEGPPGPVSARRRALEPGRARRGRLACRGNRLVGPLLYELAREAIHCAPVRVLVVARRVRVAATGLYRSGVRQEMNRQGSKRAKRGRMGRASAARPLSFLLFILLGGLRASAVFFSLA